MNWWKRRQVPTDERLEGAKRRIYKEAYFLVMAICTVSLIYKSWVHGFGTQATLLESLVLVGSSLYCLVRSITLGVIADEVEMTDRMSKWSTNQRALVTSLVAGFILAVLFGLRSAVVYGDSTNRLSHFGLVFITTLLFNVPLLAIASVVGTKVAQKISEMTSRRNTD